MKRLWLWLIVGVVITASTVSSLIVKHDDDDAEEKVLEHCADYTESSLEECLGIPIVLQDDKSVDNGTAEVSFQASRFPPTGRLAWRVSWGGGLAGNGMPAHKAVVRVHTTSKTLFPFHICLIVAAERSKFSFFTSTFRSVAHLVRSREFPLAAYFRRH